MGDRDLIAALLDDDTVAAHDRAADALADEVDRLVRERLAGTGLRLVPPRASRGTVPQARLQSLTAANPNLPMSLPAGKVTAFATRLDEWMASGAVALGRGRLCLRVHEPGTHPEPPPDTPAARRGVKAPPPADPWWLERRH